MAINKEQKQREPSAETSEFSKQNSSRPQSAMKLSSLYAGLFYAPGGGVLNDVFLENKPTNS